MSAPRTAASGVRDLARDVQRFGLLSASSVVDRYIDLVDAAVGRTPATAAPPASERPSREFEDADTTALVDSAARVAEAYLGLLDAAAQAATSASTTAGLVLDPGRPGEVVRSLLWVHNPGAEPTGAMTLTVGSLVAAGGASLAASRVDCDPSEVDSIDARGSIQLEFRVQVPNDQPPGTYHGIVVCSLAPTEPMRVAVEVLPA